MSDFTIIYGCMFAGKSTRLIEAYQDYQYDPSQKVVVKPLLDNRYNARGVSTHSGMSIPAQRVMKPEEISGLTTELTKAVFIDEIQFFGIEILSTVNYLLTLGIDVFGAGLDRDYLARDFGQMPALKALARNKIQVFARCFVCGGKADHTYRVMDSDDLILVGHSNVYEARCSSCWNKGQAAKQQAQ